MWSLCVTQFYLIGFRLVNLQPSKGRPFTPCSSTTIILLKNFSAFALWLSTKLGVKCVPQSKILPKSSQSSVNKSRAFWPAGPQRRSFSKKKLPHSLTQRLQSFGNRSGQAEKNGNRDHGPLWNYDSKSNPKSSN